MLATGAHTRPRWDAVQLWDLALRWTAAKRWRLRNVSALQDKQLQKEAESLVTAAVCRDGVYEHKKKGIPRRSAMSSFFGALYLNRLDRALENLPGVYYARYMDDVVILIKDERRYKAIRKILYRVLGELKLSLSKKKTKMGRLGKKGCHFLGMEYKPTFEESRTDKVAPRKASWLRSVWGCVRKHAHSLSSSPYLFTPGVTRGQRASSTLIGDRQHAQRTRLRLSKLLSQRTSLLKSLCKSIPKSWELSGARTPPRKIQSCEITVHKRTLQRALDRVDALHHDAVGGQANCPPDPDASRAYLRRWAIWWHRVWDQGGQSSLVRRCGVTCGRHPRCVKRVSAAYRLLEAWVTHAQATSPCHARIGEQLLRRSRLCAGLAPASVVNLSHVSGD